MSWSWLSGIQAEPSHRTSQFLRNQLKCVTTNIVQSQLFPRVFMHWISNVFSWIFLAVQYLSNLHLIYRKSGKIPTSNYLQGFLRNQLKCVTTNIVQSQPFLRVSTYWMSNVFSCSTSLFDTDLIPTFSQVGHESISGMQMIR